MTDDRHPGLVPLPGSATTLDPVAPPRAPDGRNRRVDRSKAAVIHACRQMMQAGVFQPTGTNIAKRASVSVRTLFDHFGDIESVLLAAIDDSATRDSILNQMLGDHAYSCSPEAERAIVRAAVLGRAEA